MNVVNEETPETHEGKRQLRFQKQREQDDQKSRKTKDQRERSFNFAVKRENVVSKVFGLKKTTRKYRSDSKLNGSEMPADVSVKQPNKVLPCCWIKAKVMIAAMRMKQQQQRNQRQKYLHNQQLRIQRRCEQRKARLERETLFTNSYQWI